LQATYRVLSTSQPQLQQQQVQQWEPIACVPVPPATARPRVGSPSGNPHLLASLSLPSLEDLPRYQSAPTGQLTARDTLSARAAVAEHIAMLSRDNSPRDDDVAAGGGGAGQPDGVPLAPNAMATEMLTEYFGEGPETGKAKSPC
jgi:hypothetical protein